MPWARLDDKAITNLKLRKLSHAGFRLWALGLVHCAAELTNGFIDADALALFPFKERELSAAVAELCSEQVRGKSPLWRSGEHGYHVHDYLTWNDSREHVENKRRTSRERMERVRANKPRTDGERALAHTTHTIPPTITSPTETGASRLKSAEKEADHPVNKLQRRYAELLAKNLGVEKPNINWTKVGSIFKTLLQDRDYQVVLAALEKFMADQGTFCAEAAWTIGVFSARFNQYISKAFSKADGDVSIAAAEETQRKLKKQRDDV